MQRWKVTRWDGGGVVEYEGTTIAGSAYAHVPAGLRGRVAREMRYGIAQRARHARVERIGRQVIISPPFGAA